MLYIVNYLTRARTNFNVRVRVFYLIIYCVSVCLRVANKLIKYRG